MPDPWNEYKQGRALPEALTKDATTVWTESVLLYGWDFDGLSKTRVVVTPNGALETIDSGTKDLLEQLLIEMRKMNAHLEVMSDLELAEEI